MAVLETEAESNTRRPSAFSRLNAFLLLLPLAGLLCIAPPPLSGAEAPLVGLESELKAAFLVNFPRYVDWPSGDTAPIVFALFGEGGLESDIRKAITGKTVSKRPLVFKRVTTEEECAQGCDVLFIGADERRRIPSLLERLQNKRVLTIGESDDFLERGGIIKLVRRGRNFRFQINLAAARRAGLEINSNLLSAAEVVHGKSP